jgi:hypothetical protein
VKIYVVGRTVGKYHDTETTELVVAFVYKESADAYVAEHKPKLSYDAFGSRVYRNDGSEDIYYEVHAVELKET